MALVIALALYAALANLDREYSIVSTVRLVQPYDVKAMNDEFQTAKLINEKDGVGTFEITYYPFHQQKVEANSDWRAEDAKMAEYLKPRPAANWDAQLQTEILIELRATGIEPDTLDDQTLVEKVSKWAIQRSKFNEQFGLWMVEFHGDQPAIAPTLTKGFWDNEPKGMSVGQIFSREVLGKQMVENKTHGACTSSSTYMATILRAVGIPTRIILTVPSFDANDPKQADIMTKAVRHHLALKAILRGNSSQGFSNHVFNEVWVGHKWVRLNYDVLGQSILDKNYEGLMTHVYTANDISEVPFAQTWGVRYATGGGPKLSSENPYQLVAAHDVLAEGVVLDNPPFTELSSATIMRAWSRSDKGLPVWVHPSSDTDYLIEIKEWLRGDDYHQLRDFAAQASAKFLFRSAGHPDVPATISGDRFSDGNGTFQGFGLHLQGKLDPGVAYTLVPQNEGHKHNWLVSPGLVVRG